MKNKFATRMLIAEMALFSSKVVILVNLAEKSFLELATQFAQGGVNIQT